MQLHWWPKKVQELTAGQSCVRDCIGQSGAQVWLFDCLVLKTGRGVPAIRAEKERLAYLAGRLPVPRVVHYEEVHGRAFLLMERLPGRMLCDEVYLRDPQQLVRLLAEAYALLCRADLSDCPFDAGTGALLPAARVRVQRKQCSVSDAEPGTYGPGGFQNPAALLAWLEQHVPPCEPAGLCARRFLFAEHFGAGRHGQRFCRRRALWPWRRLAGSGAWPAQSAA